MEVIREMFFKNLAKLLHCQTLFRCNEFRGDCSICIGNPKNDIEELINPKRNYTPERKHFIKLI